MGTLAQSNKELDNGWKSSLLIWKAGLLFIGLCFIVAFILNVLNVQVALS